MRKTPSEGFFAAGRRELIEGLVGFTDLSASYQAAHLSQAGSLKLRSNLVRREQVG
jgi:hypothetical protein